MIILALHAIIIVFFYMMILVSGALFYKQDSVIDKGWGLGFITLALYSLFTTNLYYPRHILVTLLVCLWGLRISIHMMVRHWKRHQGSHSIMWSKHKKRKSFIYRFICIVGLHGIIMLLIAQPILLINGSFEDHITILDMIGTTLWIIGFFFEFIGDYQLLVFLHNSENEGHILQTGLWRYSRHPNYFGESLQWWGIFLIALSVPHGWTAIMSPATITYLLLYVSGVPMVEQSFELDPEYQRYRKRTSSFIPWFTK